MPRRLCPAFDEEPLDSESEDMASEPELPSDIETDDEDELVGSNLGGGLMDFVSTLPSAKRKAEDSEVEDSVISTGGVPEDVPAKRRRVLPSRQGPGGREDAGEFGIGSGNCPPFFFSLADVRLT